MWTTFPRGDSDSPEVGLRGFCRWREGLPAWGRPRQHLGHKSLPEAAVWPCQFRSITLAARGTPGGLGEAAGVGGMQEGGPGLGRMLRRGRRAEAQRRERVLRGCRRAVGGAPPALSWHHRLPQMCPRRLESSTNSHSPGSAPCCFLRPVWRDTCAAPAGVLICSGPAVNVQIISFP